MKYLKEYKEFEWDYEEYPDNPIPDDFVNHEKFYNFLENNDALNNWINNFNYKHYYTIKKFLDKVKIYDYIDSAFNWKNSPEHHEYWSDLNKKWIND